MKKHTILLLYFLWIASTSFFVTSCTKEDIIHPRTKKIIEAVYASGKLLPEDDYKVYSMADGTIRERMVNEGDSVSKGQLLLTIENIAQYSQMETAEEMFRIAKKNSAENSPILEELRLQLSNAEKKFTDDSLTYMRIKALWSEKAVSTSEYDKAEIRFESSRNDVRAANERLQKTKNQLALDYANARNQVRVNTQQNSYYEVRSAMDGLVYELYKKAGEVVKRYEPVAALGRKNAFIIQLWVDEQDIHRITLGQKVVIKMDVLKGETFEARIRKIYPTLNEQNQSIRVDAEFIHRPPTLVANAVVEANIIISEKESALTLPKKYISGDSVQVRNAQGQKEKVRVKRGIENAEDVEILEGLTQNSEIIVSK